MRISHTVSHTIQEGSANAAVMTRGGVAVYQIVTEHTEVYMDLAASAPDTALALGGVTAVKTLYLECTQDMSIKLGGTGQDPILVEANFPLALVLSTTVATVHVANLATEAAVVKGILGG